jgi:hypothetical protein
VRGRVGSWRAVGKESVRGGQDWSVGAGRAGNGQARRWESGRKVLGWYVGGACRHGPGLMGSGTSAGGWAGVAREVGGNRADQEWTVGKERPGAARRGKSGEGTGGLAWHVGTGR